MATTYPSWPRSAFLEWCLAHKAVFLEHAAELGLTTEEATAFAAAVTLGKDRLLAQQMAKEAAKVGTQQCGDAFDDLSRRTGNIVRTIRAFAESSGDPNAVYAAAQIPPHADASPLPPPGKPRNLSVTLDATLGSITLNWKADNPVGSSGTSYIVRRRLPGERSWTFLGVSGKKTYVDDTLTAGPDSVQYIVQGQRGDVSGPVSNIFSVNFGKRAGGVRAASVSTAAANVGAGTVGVSGAAASVGAGANAVGTAAPSDGSVAIGVSRTAVGIGASRASVGVGRASVGSASANVGVGRASVGAAAPMMRANAPTGSIVPRAANTNAANIVARAANTSANWGATGAARAFSCRSGFTRHRTPRGSPF